ncbi:hypothetical protein EDC01DRAFT_786612 [Geopyxis carbonaria]|nr:hypothetical protein EDC01DRAFT_786612 [Geopyxis carbonaria]
MARGKGKKRKNKNKSNEADEDPKPWHKKKKAEEVPLTAEQRAELFKTIPHDAHQQALLCDLKLFLDRYFLDADGHVCPAKATPDRPLVFKNLPAETRSALAAAVAALPGLHFKELVCPKDPEDRDDWSWPFDPLTGVGSGLAQLTTALRNTLVDNAANAAKHAQFLADAQAPGATREDDARGRWYMTCGRIERRWTVWCEVGLRVIIDWDDEREPAQAGGPQSLQGEFHLGIIGGLMRFWRDGEDYATSYISLRADSDGDPKVEADGDPKVETDGDPKVEIDGDTKVEPAAVQPPVTPADVDPAVAAAPPPDTPAPAPTDPNRKLHFRWRGVMQYSGGHDDDYWEHDFSRNTGVLVFDETFTSFRGVFHARHTFLGEDVQLRGYKIQSGEGIARGDACQLAWRMFGSDSAHCERHPQNRGTSPRLFSGWR